MFWLLKDSELTPTGSNLLDGRFAVFGYIVESESILADLKVRGELKGRWYLVLIVYAIASTFSP